MESLETLCLSNNELASLPLEMSKLPRLRKLTIDNNKFNQFPPVISQIVSLTSISFAANDGIKVESSP